MGLLLGDTLVEPDSMARLLTLMELRTINVVRVSMVLPMGVVFIIKALVPALASPTLLQATLQVSGMSVILERVRATVTVSTVPVGLKQSEETTGETSAPSVALESPLPALLLSHALVVE